MRNPSWTWTIQCASSFLGSSASTSNFAKLHFLDPHSTIIVETTINYFQPLFLLLNLTAIIISSNTIMCAISFWLFFFFYFYFSISSFSQNHLVGVCPKSILSKVKTDFFISVVWSETRSESSTSSLRNPLSRTWIMFNIESKSILSSLHICPRKFWEVKTRALRETKRCNRYNNIAELHI